MLHRGVGRANCERGSNVRGQKWQRARETSAQNGHRTTYTHRVRPTYTAYTKIHARFLRTQAVYDDIHVHTRKIHGNTRVFWVCINLCMRVWEKTACTTYIHKNTRTYTQNTRMYTYMYTYAANTRKNTRKNVHVRRVFIHVRKYTAKKGEIHVHTHTRRVYDDIHDAYTHTQNTQNTCTNTRWEKVIHKIHKKNTYTIHVHYA